MDLAVKTLVANKAIDPVLLEVRDLSSFTDYFLIASGGSKRHVLALAEHLQEALSGAGIKPLGVEGLEEGLWVLLDYNIMVIHIFFQPLREFYNLEGLWSEAPKTAFASAADSHTSLSSEEALSFLSPDAGQISHD